jgi:hypothetical protein
VAGQHKLELRQALPVLAPLLNPDCMRNASLELVDALLQV